MTVNDSGSSGHLRAAGVLGLSAVLLASATWMRAAEPRPAAPAASPTFSANVAPIIYSNCVVCHRPGQAAPFSLLTYDDVRKHGETIVDVTTSRYMPPWHAARAEGFPEFRDERRLTDADLHTLKDWVAAGMPAGDLEDDAPAAGLSHGWALGVPDLIVRMARPISVPADGPDLYRNVTMSIDLPDDRWITAVDFEPTARTVVHHALFFSGPASEVIGDDELLPGLGRGACAAATVGPPARPSGLGWARRLGAGHDAALLPGGHRPAAPQAHEPRRAVHFHPSGKAEVEQGQLATRIPRKRRPRSR